MTASGAGLREEAQQSAHKLLPTPAEPRPVHELPVGSRSEPPTAASTAGPPTSTVTGVSGFQRVGGVSTDARVATRGPSAYRAVPLCRGGRWVSRRLFWLLRVLGSDKFPSGGGRNREEGSEMTRWIVDWSLSCRFGGKQWEALEAPGCVADGLFAASQLARDPGSARSWPNCKVSKP